MPAVAAKLVAPAEVNCSVAPSSTDAVVGEIACIGAMRVTVAPAEPLGPVAVTVTVLDVGIVAGAV